MRPMSYGEKVAAGLVVLLFSFLFCILIRNLQRKEEEECKHTCTGDCRREGCNCPCGKWHKESI